MTTNPLVSLIFVNYQSIWQLSFALKKLFFYEPHRELFEVIVVNNDKSEQRALAQLAERFSFRLVSLTTNQGFGRAANEGVLVARGKILGFLNPDTEWQEACLGRIIQSFEGKRQPQIIGMALLTKEGKREPYSAGAAPSIKQLIKNNLLPFLVQPQALPEDAFDWVSGGGFFVAREVFGRLHGFDERFFLYFEDVDLCLRAKKNGVQIVSDPRFTLVHQGGKSFASYDEQKKYFYTSQARYFEKHRPVFEFFLIRVLHGIFQRT